MTTNHVLSLRELDRPFFRETIASMRKLVEEFPGFVMTDPPDLNVDWPVVKEQMLRFHGYPYTSIGVVLVKR
jgi:hypothetical protein